MKSSLTYRGPLRIFLVLLFASLLTGCLSESSVTTNKKLNVVTTTGMIADLVKEVGGEHVSVSALMGPGVDPHLYKATQSDVNRMMKADLILYQGLNLEGKLVEILDEMNKTKPAHAVTDGIDRKQLIRASEQTEYFDPHIWFDVSLWTQVVDEIATHLSEVDGHRKQTYLENAKSYKQKLAELDKEARESLATIANERRVLITAHDAFSYFGRAYGFQVVGLQGISTESEYSLNDVRNVVQIVSDRNIRTIFTETSVSDRSLRAVIEGAKANGVDIQFGQPLYSDALGPAGTDEGTYIGMFRANVTAIVNGLK